MLRQGKNHCPILLAVMLIVAPLNAHVAFACNMMDTMFRGECCCEAPDACLDSVCAEVLEKERAPCCERSVEIGVAYEAQSVLKTIEVRSDVDPPPLLAAIDYFVPARLSAFVAPIECHVLVRDYGSATYLATQRLRI